MKRKAFLLTGILYLYAIVVFAQIQSTEENATTPYEEIIKNHTPLTAEELPPQVTSSFDERFPQNDHPVWTREGDHYSVRFEREGRMIRSDYGPEGDWRGDYSRIEIGKLPENIQTYVENNIEVQRIKEIYEVDKLEGKQFEIYVIGESEIHSLIFDQAGNLKENR
ncbi:hypothetical protein BH23BAC1_BH23BAC1_10010 [soil metagenome]